MSSRRSSIVIEPALVADDQGLRDLLRSQEMQGRVRLSMRRDPRYAHGAAVEGRPHHVVVARDLETGRIIGMASRAVQNIWLDGQPRKIGYLAQLRRANEARLSHLMLRKGFELLEATRQPDELPFDLTSIMADNIVARRLLERGLPGLPRYRPICPYVTLTFSTRRSRKTSSIEPAQKADLESIVECLQRNLRRSQLAPVWTAEDLTSPSTTRGLGISDFLVMRDDKVSGRGCRARACAAIWDQRSFRQTIVTGYSTWLGLARPLLNLGLTLAKRPALPQPNRPLALAYLSHLACEANDTHALLELIEAARDRASRRGIDLLAVGLPRTFPGLASISGRLKAHRLDSMLYLVSPESDGSPADRLELGAASPEVALL